MKSRISDYLINLEFFVLPKLTNKLPLVHVSKYEFKIPLNIKLADPCFNTPKTVDMILDAEIFFELLNSERLKPIPRGPTWQNTRFGWIVSGAISSTSILNENKSTVSLVATLPLDEINLENQMLKCWCLEEVKAEETYTLEEKSCKQHFEKNVKRTGDGRFTVVLPFRDNIQLGKSYESALRRFQGLERRFQSNLKLKNEYVHCTVYK